MPTDLTAVAPAVAVTPQPPATLARARQLRRQVSAWAPAALVLVATVLVLRYHGVGLAVQGRYLAYLTLVVLVPGTLVWRCLRGGPGRLPADIVGGAAVGYAFVVLSYLAGRAVGMPYLPVAVAGAVLVAFGVVRPLRRHWRGGGASTAVAWSWSVAAVALFVLGWGASAYFRVHGLSWPASGTPYTDMVFHQALVGELRHHLPAQMPYVAGLPLRYHWFVHADWAATSWATGIEPLTLTYRLGTLPAALLLVVGVAVAADRVVGGRTTVGGDHAGVGLGTRWWVGPLAAVLAIVTVAPDPARWSTAVAPTAHLPRTMWLSPTQTFASLLFVGLFLVLADLLVSRADRRATPASRWLLYALLAVVVAGAKATYLPLLIAALVLVVAVDLGRRRGLNRPALIAAAVAAVAMGIAQLTMFRGTSGGLLIDPLASLDAALPRPTGSGWTVGHIAAIWAFTWAAVLLAGATLLLRRQLADPLLLFCVGMGVAAVAVVLLTYQMGNSHHYFLQAARPFVAIIVVAALAHLTVDRAAPGRAGPADVRTAPDRAPLVRALAVAFAVACGAVTAAQVAAVTADTAPTAAQGWLTVRALWPYAAPALLAAALAAVAMLWPAARRSAILVALAALIGATIPSTVDAVEVIAPRDGRLRDVIVPAGPAQTDPVIPAGAARAGRWLRAHTSVDDLLATNNHCRLASGPCDPRQFWLAAFAERRVLVEGWGFTAPANAIASRDRLSSDEVPFWDQAKLAENDAAFLRPSAGTVRQLRDRHGVRWLVVDTRRPYDPALARHAMPRFAAGEVAVYEILPG
ncbi:hypothetical protein [Pilimelia columellifera]|uniref:Uncharacterized protein n=1 Tax=Pilimelia columellifera subsp. columellifera TaxID=706583 RepID=A0ABP6AZF3_9ACTN